MQTTSRTDGQDLMDTPSKTPKPQTPSKGTAQSAKGQATNTAKGAKSSGTQAGSNAKSSAKQQAPVEDAPSEAPDDATDDLNEQVDDAEEDGEQAVEGATGEDEEGGEEEGGEEQGAEDQDGEDQGGEDQGGEEGEDDEGDDIVPAGKVADDGRSVVDNEGSVIGSVAGKGNKKLAGSVVDQEGDIVDQEGNVLGQAEPAGEAGEAAEGAAGGAQDAAGGLLGNVTGAVGGITNKAGGLLGNTAEGLGDVAGGDVQGGLGKTAGGAVDAAGGIAGEAGNAAGGITDQAGNLVGGVFPEAQGALSLGEGGLVDETGKLIGQVPDDLQDKLKDTPIKEISPEGQIIGEDGGILGKALPPEVNDAVDGVKDTVGGVFPQAQGALQLGEGGLVDEAGNLIGQVPQDLQEKLKDTPIKEITKDGDILGENGDVLGKATPPEVGDAVEGAKDAAGDVAEGKFPDAQGLMKAVNGQVTDEAGNVIGTIPEDLQKKIGDKPIKEINEKGEIIGEDGKVLGQAELPEEAKEAAEGAKDTAEDAAEGQFPDAQGLMKAVDGQITDEAGNVIGTIPKDLQKKIGDTPIKEINDKGDIIGEDGKVLGQAELPEEAQEAGEKAKSPFPKFSGSLNCDDSGTLTDSKGRVIGSVPEDIIQDVQGSTVKEITADGDMLDEDGNSLGKANPPQPLDYKKLDGATVTKTGNVVDSNGTVIGILKRGNPKSLEGKQCDENGDIWDNKGKKAGHAEPLPNEQVADKTVGPFDDFDDAKVMKNGDVMSGDQKIGEVTEGDPKKLAGKTVDSDGSILDKNGNVLGRAERWEEPEAEEEAPPDLSALAGKRVNKAGNVVDTEGNIFGKVVEGDPKALAGKMCGKNGEIFDEGGNVVGRAELVEASQQGGAKEGPFSAFQPCTVKKDGTVVGPAGNIVGRITQGDPKSLEGRQVDQDGDITDQNGNSLGKAERWEPEEEEKDVHPAHGMKVNKEGFVIDSNGDKVAKLTDGDLSRCHGKKIDEEGNVVDQKGNPIGFVTLMENLQPEGPTEEELEAQRKAEEEQKAQDEEQRKKDEAQAKEDEQKEKEKKLAKRMSFIIEEKLEKMNRICKAITDYVNDAEQTPKEELDEDQLVKNVRPLIEEGGAILDETNKEIRQMDPEGKMQAQAKQKASEGEATPEEHRLANLLKELTGSVTETIDNAKRKIAGMPHAQKELNPLWGLLTEPLFQILAAVGLLLSGVLGLVGKLLGGLGLGNLLGGVLGSLGLDKLLGGGKKGGKSLGGLPGGLLGGLTGKK